MSPNVSNGEVLHGLDAEVVEGQSRGVSQRQDFMGENVSEVLFHARCHACKLLSQTDGVDIPHTRPRVHHLYLHA